MKKRLSKLVAIAAAASLVLSGCGSNPTSTPTTGATQPQGTTTGSEPATTTAAPAETSSKKPLKDLLTYQTVANEMETFNILYSQSSKELDVLTNCIEGLLTCDNYGEVAPALAEEWGTEDGGLTWTFKLRPGVKWVDVNGNEMADCTSEDFVTGLEFILNYHKNSSANTSMPVELIKGAAEYYQYTKDLSPEEALALDITKFKETVGIETPDELTVIYTCTAPKPYFDTVATYNCLYPAPKGLIDKLTPEGFQGINNMDMWYNGCYLMTTYTQGNEKILTKNEAYWDKECTLFDTVTIKMVESLDVGYQLFQSGEIDHINLSESNLKTISDSTSNPYYKNLVEKRPTKYSFQYHFNYNKFKEDGTEDTNWNLAIANLNFRKAWYYGLDLKEYYGRTNGINPLKCENNAYTMAGLVYMSDGRDYVDVVKEKLNVPPYNGETMARLDKEKAAEYKKQAMEELAAQGVTFPVEIDYYIAGNNQTTLDTAIVLKQAFADSLGSDFVQMNIKTYVTSFQKEVRDPKLHSFVTNGWGADYGDPQNYLGQETYGQDNAFYGSKYSNVNDIKDEALVEVYKKFTDMVDAANQINDDLDKRYEAYAEAEVYMLENALVVPNYYDIKWQLTRVNDYSKINAMYGCQNGKYKNWETSEDIYTTEDYEAFEAAYNSRAK